MYTCAEQNQPAQVRSSREGVAWNYSKVVLPTMSQLDLKTWLTWWQSIGLVKLYSSEDKWVPNSPVNPDDSRFCSTFPWPEGNKPHEFPHHGVAVSTGGRLALLLPKSAGIAKRLPWLDVMHVKTIIYILLYMHAIRHHSWCTWG